MSTDIPRPEYPRPQFVRERWANLNGQWQFEFDPGDSGLERGILKRELMGTITVPFAPESILSGIGDVDFHECVWYRREFDVPPEWAGDRVVLHFQAVDHDSTVWVNGVEVGRHRGGFSSFSFDITDALDGGTSATIVLRARDSKDAIQARGKQSRLYHNHVCDYTRTTGIWQTVWAEPVPAISMRRPRITPELASSSFHIDVPLTTNLPRGEVRVRLLDDEGLVADTTVRADLDLAPKVVVGVPEARRRLWSISDPHLYRLEIELVDRDGTVVDRVASYAGLRSVSIVGKSVRINGEPVFQRLVLDQGYYADGIMTAPSDAALIRDIELGQEAGFNGARLHQKVFEERFLYHADRLGYLVWGEFGDWGSRTDSVENEQQPTATYITQWLEVVERDYSHPSIVGWCPLNETRQFIRDAETVLDDVTRGMFLATKAFDTSRPTIDASGYSHRVTETDVYDSHNYEQDPTKFAEVMDLIKSGRPYINREGEDDPAIDARPWSVEYQGQPYFCSEFGGIWWNPAASDVEDSWGYGQRPGSIDEFYSRFEGLVDALLNNDQMFGYCYTQLTDVFQEQNGIYYFDRTAKFDVAKLLAIQSKPAAIEKERELG